MRTALKAAAMLLLLAGSALNKRAKVRRLTLLFLFFSFPTIAKAQNVPFSDIVLSASGRPIGGASVSVCNSPGLQTTAASVTSNLAILTFASSPIAAGFAVSMTLQVSGFTGADTYFDGGTITNGTITGGFTILAVTSTTITYGVTHANASATSNGFAFQQGNSSMPCAPLASITSDQAGAQPITQPGLSADGLGNYSFYAPSGPYIVQYNGASVTPRVRPIAVPVSTANNNAFTGSDSFSQPIISTVAIGTAPFSIASTTVVPNLNVALHGGLTAPASAIVGSSDTQTLTNKTFDISANTLKTATNTTGHLPRNNGTQYVDAQLGFSDLGGNISTSQMNGGTGASSSTFWRGDATWQAVASSAVTQITYFSGAGGQGFVNGLAACPASTGVGNGECIRTVLAQSHTLLRLTMDVSSLPVGCTTNAVVGFKDLTSGAVLSSFTITNSTPTTLNDSGALSVAMTSGDQFGLGLLTSPAGCTTSPGIYTLVAVYQ